MTKKKKTSKTNNEKNHLRTNRTNPKTRKKIPPKPKYNPIKVAKPNLHSVLPSATSLMILGEISFEESFQRLRGARVIYLALLPSFASPFSSCSYYSVLPLSLRSPLFGLSSLSIRLYSGCLLSFFLLFGLSSRLLLFGNYYYYCSYHYSSYCMLLILFFLSLSLSFTLSFSIHYCYHN